MKTKIKTACAKCGEIFFIYLNSEKILIVKEINLYLNFECTNCQQEIHLYKEVE